MKPGIASYAHRKLKTLKRYISTENIESPEMTLESGVILGYYQSEENVATERVIFTTLGVSANIGNAWRYVPYADIAKVDREARKTFKDFIILQLISGDSVAIKIGGKDVEHGTHDKYAIMMFLDCAINSRGE